VDFTNGSVSKTLRVPHNTWDDPKGYDANTYQNQKLSGVFANREQRVLDMMQLSKTLATTLAAAPINKAPGYYQPNQPDAEHRDHLLSSDFAMEMVQGVGLVSFINYPQGA
jgi:hypothetical protein